MGEAIAEQLQDQAAQIIRLRSELAEARRALLAGNDTVLANKKLQEDNAAKDARIAYERVEGDKILAALEMANARIAEVTSAFYGMKELCTKLRGERVEAGARIAELEAERALHIEAYKAMLARAERAQAERDAMREVLELVDADVRHHLRSDAIDHALLRKHAVAAVRAALAPSPGGPEG